MVASCWRMQLQNARRLARSASGGTRLLAGTDFNWKVKRIYRFSTEK